MKLKHFLSVLMFVSCLTATVMCQEIQKNALLKRGLLKGRGGQPATTSTTTTEQAIAEEEYDEADYAAEGEQAEIQNEAAPEPSTSTEGKKILQGGLARPSSSNKDLIEALKRRRQQAVEAKLNHKVVTQAPVDETPAETQAPVKANNSKKRFSTSSRTEAVAEPNAAPSKPNRRFSSRPTKAIKPENEQPVEETPQPPNTRSGRAFLRRGSN